MKCKKMGLKGYSATTPLPWLQPVFMKDREMKIEEVIFIALFIWVFLSSSCVSMIVPSLEKRGYICEEVKSEEWACTHPDEKLPRRFIQ